MKTLIPILIAATVLPLTATPDDGNKRTSRKPVPAKRQQAAPKGDCKQGIHSELSALSASVGELRKTLAGKKFNLAEFNAKLTATEEALATSTKKSDAMSREIAELRKALATSKKNSGKIADASATKFAELTKKYEMARRVATKTLASSATKTKAHAEELARCKAENAAMKKDCEGALAAITALRQQIEKLNKDLSEK